MFLTAEETIRDPRVEADSIKGLGEKVRPYVKDRVPLAIPLDQVVDLEAVGKDEVGTVFTVLGVLVGVLVVTYAVSCAVTDTSDSFVDLCAY